MSNICENIELIRSELNPNTKLIAVSKTKPSSLIREAYNCGQRDFGENKVQELLEKSIELKDLTEIRWHFIGNLQSNKVNQLLKVQNLYSIHSIDSTKLLRKILSKRLTSKIKLFLQINTSEELEKNGYDFGDSLGEDIKLILDSECFEFIGLMTIGKIRSENFEDDARLCFRKLSDKRKKLDSNYNLNLELSMGMSSDYLIALDYDTNWVRIGSKVFGSRL